MNREDTLKQIVENFQAIKRGFMREHANQRNAIPYGQKAALLVIALHGKINIKLLAGTLHVTSGAATQHVEALTSEGLVERAEDSSDRRNVIISLSTKGQTVFKQLQHEQLLLTADLFKDVSDEELQAYLKITQKLIKRFEEKA